MKGEPSSLAEIGDQGGGYEAFRRKKSLSKLSRRRGKSMKQGRVLCKPTLAADHGDEATQVRIGLRFPPATVSATD